jgi:hypothetical protein
VPEGGLDNKLFFTEHVTSSLREGHCPNYVLATVQDVLGLHKGGNRLGSLQKYMRKIYDFFGPNNPSTHPSPFLFGW